MDPGSAAHRKGAALRPGNVLPIPEERAESPPPHHKAQRRTVLKMPQAAIAAINSEISTL
jgi:hypothetical protein